MAKILNSSHVTKRDLRVTKFEEGKLYVRTSGDPTHKGSPYICVAFSDRLCVVNLTTGTVLSVDIANEKYFEELQPGSVVTLTVE